MNSLRGVNDHRELIQKTGSLRSIMQRSCEKGYYHFLFMHFWKIKITNIICDCKGILKTDAFLIIFTCLYSSSVLNWIFWYSIDTLVIRYIMLLNLIFMILNKLMKVLSWYIFACQIFGIISSCFSASQVVITCLRLISTL